MVHCRLYTQGMAVSIDLPAATLRRLEAEALRRGVDLEVVITELVEALPDPDAEDSQSGHRFAFTGVAASGDGTLSERYKEIRRAEFGS